VAQFAHAEDLAAYLGRELSAEEEARAESSLLAIASSIVQRYTGQTIELVEDDEATIYAGGVGHLFLPELPVSAIDSIEVDGTALDSAAYALTGSGMLSRRDGLWGPSVEGWSDAVVVVTYTHGFAVIPDDIVQATVMIASELFSNPGDVQQESIGSYSVSYGGEDTTDIPDHARALLDKYRVVTLA
jgi:hypothetical protein